jgi:uncharacterized membrane protein YeaQ/YmgE (transglycosylase-associated protein family)
VNILSWILFGLIAGAIAKLLMPGKDPGGCLVTIALGLAGAVLGGFLGTEVFHWGRPTGFDLRSFVIAIAGAVILLLLYRLIVRRRSQ